MKKSLALLFILIAASAPAQEAEDAAMTALRRMRDQLRTVMLQQQKTEADRAALAAEKPLSKRKSPRWRPISKNSPKTATSKKTPTRRRSSP
ncbi:MAG: hypothetical protein IPK32_08920 [Verrucomicrobiaceae bacterium]|nr:hypothetical protein [Verrucomicrobiaceae bacterium]